MTTTTRSALHTPLCDLLGIRYPICQAGMGYVARSALAAAVSEAGGLGVIAAAQFTPRELREDIRSARELTDKPFGVDILFASVRVSGDHKITPAGDVVRALVEEAEAVLDRLAR
jgi:enoyl-[acyl-carrier protein] reductase II